MKCVTHFQDLHILLPNIKCEFSAICISETSQKFDEKFKGNVSIHGFTEPFTSGSLSSKRGVAIYIKDTYKVYER